MNTLNVLIIAAWLVVMIGGGFVMWFRDLLKEVKKEEGRK